MSEASANPDAAPGGPAQPPRMGVRAWLRHVVGCPNCRPILYILGAHAAICLVSAFLARRAIAGLRPREGPRPMIQPTR